jgi:hypothetical protein
LNQVAIYVGNFIETVANAGFRFRGGPAHTASSIEKFFGDYDEREAALDKLYADWGSGLGQPKVLQDHCHKLLKFARSE